MKIKKIIKKVFGKEQLTKDEIEYYTRLYHQVHDLDNSLDIAPGRTAQRFAEQWENLPTGKFLLSDPDFRNKVDSILSEEEILIKREWFKGKNVLDAGCGNGRWSYGFAKLGAKLTCVDINQIAIDETRKALKEFNDGTTFIVSSLEQLELPQESFDLVFSWGVLHHCVSFTKSLRNLTRVLKDGGILYLYLYGRESLPMEEDLKLFKKRIEYNMTSDPNQRYQILLERTGGDKTKLHAAHDLLAPTINRRFTFEQIKEILENMGYTQIVQTIKHTELFIRAIKGNHDYNIFLPSKEPPYWFQR